MIRIMCFALAFLISSFGALADSNENINRRQKEIQSWNNFVGVWEGSFAIVYAPSHLIGPGGPQDVRLEIDSSDTKVWIREPNGEWKELDGKIRAIQANEITLFIELYRSGGAWVETLQFLMARAGKDKAKTFVQRVVNNWATSDSSLDKDVFLVERVGIMSRIAKK